MPIREKAQLMSAAEIDRTLVRLAHEIVERNQGSDNVALIGIVRRGVPLSQRLADRIEQIEKRKVPVGRLEISLYRDDLSTVGPQPVVIPSFASCSMKAASGWSIGTSTKRPCAGGG